ncbi:putative methyltransferase NSUN7 [Brienomyrus brachyistius]|uniref:putative methyltransferase NSUN7 n=1 Tax=Brienomyrus brachyistius TaxID=42636 RepID=UPI0020B40B15|nr:putative methyltransferase NSUN7 [Brienomyrus brachyistius]
MYDIHRSTDLSLQDEADTVTEKLSTQLPGAPQWTTAGPPDHVYLLAATIFQSFRLEMSSVRRLIDYGEKTKPPVPKARDEASRHWAYELAFNTLTYHELLEDTIIDSSLSYIFPADMMSLAMVMLYDLQDRKFIPQKRPSSDQVERLADVVEAERCLNSSRTKLAASLARCRIRRGLLSIDAALPESVRKRRERASSLPLFAWVNSLKTCHEDICSALEAGGFSQVNGLEQLQGATFCQDPHCQELLAFPSRFRGHLYGSPLFIHRKLLVQDKCRTLALKCVSPLLAKGSNLLLAGTLSASSIAHAATLAAPHSAQVYICRVSHMGPQRGELQRCLSDMGCKNVRLLPELFTELEPSDMLLYRVHVILLMPPCSASGVSDPVQFLLAESGDLDLLPDLCRGSLSSRKLTDLEARQMQYLTHAMMFPKVREVLYCTCSVRREENEDVVERALQLGGGARHQPFRVKPPALTSISMSPEGAVDDPFFRKSSSEDSNGCFIAWLTMELDPEEEVQKVLERALAKGLLAGDGVGGVEASRPPKKTKRRRMGNVALGARPAAWPRASSTRQVHSQEVSEAGSQPGGSLKGLVSKRSTRRKVGKRKTAKRAPKAKNESLDPSPFLRWPRPNTVSQ